MSCITCASLHWRRLKTFSAQCEKSYKNRNSTKKWIGSAFWCPSTRVSEREREREREREERERECVSFSIEW